MARYRILLILLTGTSLNGSECTINIKPEWQSLERSNTNAAKFGGKWILVGTITFQKKCKEPVKLTELGLAWHGPLLNYLTGSLYKKVSSKEFAPIEENFLSDATWNKTTQELSFEFSHKSQTLGPLSTFYIVLTIPDAVEPLLKQGSFSIIKQQLPDMFKIQVQSTPLTLALNQP